jgi:ribonuclease J
MSQAELKIVPLGGLGEIGMNCMALEHPDGVLVVDCGTSFPTDDHGIDVIRPNFRYLEQQGERVKGVFLTHGHEDHIGAVAHLLGRMSVPVYGPSHALGLVRRRMTEQGFDCEKADLRTALVGERYTVGPFEVEPVRVAHSIVEASALAIRSTAGTVVHTGDFDFDPDPPFGEPTNEQRLLAIGDEGVDLLLSDSTNIDLPDRNGSERLVSVAIERLARGAQERLFIALFASNVQRLATLGALAQRLDRKLCLLGRSLNTQAQVGHDIGRLKWPSDMLIGVEQLRDYPRERVMVLVGGTQAERNSSMYRLAKGNHRWVEISRGDMVVFSSRVIPGNERPVHEVVCDLMRLGAIVHTRETDPDVHVSGHASRAEQLRMLEIIRPKAFVPVHGTLHHLNKHAKLAELVGCTNIKIIENGSCLTLRSGSLFPADGVPCGRVPMDLGGRPLEITALDDRIELGRQGIANVSLVVGDGGTLAVPPLVSLWGVPGGTELSAVSRTVALELARFVPQLVRRRRPIEEEVRRVVRRLVGEATGCRPAVDVLAHYLED